MACFLSFSIIICLDQYLRCKYLVLADRHQTFLVESWKARSIRLQLLARRGSWFLARWETFLWLPFSLETSWQPLRHICSLDLPNPLPLLAESKFGSCSELGLRLRWWILESPLQLLLCSSNYCGRIGECSFELGQKACWWSSLEASKPFMGKWHASHRPCILDNLWIGQLPDPGLWRGFRRSWLVWQAYSDLCGHWWWWLLQ